MDGNIMLVGFAVLACLVAAVVLPLDYMARKQEKETINSGMATA
jgi:hypothetical protein